MISPRRQIGISWRGISFHDDRHDLRGTGVSDYDWASDRDLHGADGRDLFLRAGGDQRFVDDSRKDVFQHDKFYPPRHPLFHSDRQPDEFRRDDPTVVSLCQSLVGHVKGGSAMSLWSEHDLCGNVGIGRCRGRRLGTVGKEMTKMGFDRFLRCGERHLRPSARYPSEHPLRYFRQYDRYFRWQAFSGQLHSGFLMGIGIMVTVYIIPP